MSAVDLVTIRLTWAEDVPPRPDAHLLRGAVAGLFPGNPLFHQHDGQGVLYRHPQVQYRWDHDGPILFGINEGARFLASVDWPGRVLRIGDRPLTVRDAVCSFRRHEIRPSERLLRYRFMAPWLPLNQENYRRYQSLAPGAQEAERDRLAVAGLLVALRGFGVEFLARLYAAFDLHATRPCRYKGVDLLGFRGRLLTNVDLPDGFALGRAVSHGYGWLCRDDSAPPPQGASDDRDSVAAHPGR
jgi:hypothetical protein